jgi:hypothetical protein
LAKKLPNFRILTVDAEEYFVFWPGDAEKWLLPVQLKEHLCI